MPVVIRGATACVEVVGDNRPIVFLHGLPADHRLMMRNLEPAFAGRPGWRRIYPDLPGMGRTPAPDWIVDQQGMLDWTLGLVDAVLEFDQSTMRLPCSP